MKSRILDTFLTLGCVYLVYLIAKTVWTVEKHSAQIEALQTIFIEESEDLKNAKSTKTD